MSRLGVEKAEAMETERFYILRVSGKAHTSLRGREEGAILAVAKALKKSGFEVLVTEYIVYGTHHTVELFR